MTQKTPIRFAISMKIFSSFYIKTPEVIGIRNLTEIPEDKPLVIASTHLSDIDVQTIAAFVAPYRNVGFASQVTNQRHLIIGTLLRIAGIENIFDITNEYDAKKHISRYTFNPEDFETMKNAAIKGKTIIIAAHKPTFNWKLPEKAGKGAVYLAQLTKAVILPIALDIRSKNPVGMAYDTLNTIKRFILGKRPNAQIIIGKPIQPDPISNEDLIQMIKLHNKEEKDKLSEESLKNAKSTLAKLHKQGDMVLNTLADMLPQEKRHLPTL